MLINNDRLMKHPIIILNTIAVCVNRVGAPFSLASSAMVFLDHTKTSVGCQFSTVDVVEVVEDMVKRQNLKS